MDPVLDYYNRTPQVSLGAAPQLSPSLMQAIQTRPQEDMAAKKQQLIQQAMQEKQAQQQAAGLGVQIKPEGDQVLFPMDSFQQKIAGFERQRFEYQKKKDEIDALRRDAFVKANTHLARPDVVIQPEHVIKNARAAYEALINQKYPEMQDVEKAIPQSNAPDFAKEYPQIAGAGGLRSNISEMVSKRSQFISKLKDQINLIETEPRKGESQNQFNDRISTTLKSMLKIYNSALVGTSDALSNTERSSLSPEINESVFEPKAWFRIGGGGAMKSNIEGFKYKLQTLHDMLYNEVNTGFNALAAQTSPEYANQSVGFNQFIPYNIISTVPRIDRNAPLSVIRGEQSMAQALLEKQAKLDEATQNYWSQIDRLVREGKASEQEAAAAASQKFQKQFGISLPARKQMGK